MTDIVAALESAGFTAFARALGACGYGDVIKHSGDYTIFARTDGAFLHAEARAYLKANETLQRPVVGNHLAAGKVLSARFIGKRIRAATLAGGSVVIAGNDGLSVNGAKLVQPDILIGACVVHGIDGVLWPKTAAPVAR